jgi:hypothetical protein
VELTNKDLSFHGLLKRMAVVNMLNHNSEAPRYIFESHLAEQDDNLVDVKFRWVDPTSKKVYKGGTQSKRRACLCIMRLE